MNVSAVAVSGQDFNTSGLSLPLQIGAGQSSSFEVTFSPQANGNATGSLSVADDGSTAPLEASLSGTGITRQLMASPATINFGDVSTGGQKTQSVTLTSTGTASVEITQAKVAGAGFSISGISLPITLAAGQSTTFDAKFAPASQGAATGSVSLSTNASGPPVSMSLSGDGVTGQLAASTAEVNFGSVRLGSTGTQAVTLTNTGTEAVTITNSTVSGSGFSVTGLALPLTLNPGATTSLDAEFKPTAAGSVSGSVSFISNATGSPTVVSLAGTGSTFQLSVSSGSLNFGNVALGSAVSQQVTLTNTGTAPLDVTQASLTGNGFSLSGLTLPLVLAAGQQVTFSATFSPTAPGNAAGSVSLVSNAANSPAVVSLSATGVTLQLSASPSTIAFSNITAGTTGTETVTLTNTGTGGVTVSQASITGLGFSLSGLTVPFTLAAGEHTSLSVSFSPTAAGNATGSISIASNASNSPSAVALSGTGVTLQLSASPSTVAFGNVAVGTTGTQTLTLTNTGTGTITISQAGVTGTGFSLSGLTLPLTLAAGQGKSFSGMFSPTTTGSATGSVSIVSNAPNSPATLALSGSGVTIQISLSPGSVNFGNVVVGASNDQPILVSNSGTASVTINQANVTGTGFSVSGLSLPLTIPSGANASFDAIFCPSATGTANGNIALVSNPTNSPNNISLSGDGVNSHSVLLSWTASDSPNISGYNIYRGSVSGGPYTLLNSSLVSGTTYTDNTVQADQTYYYVSTAVNSSDQESAYSKEAQAVVPSP